jgi:formamidopyrimidine-DNA glycosylase
LVAGQEALAKLDRGGLEVMSSSVASFAAALRAENHTLKRSLTDPRILSGIGNAYSDEILHRAQLSPIKLTSTLDDAEVERLHHATLEVLEEWTRRLREQARDEIPSKVTAFRPEMVAHGKYGKPCPRCGTKIQRIVYANNETNYCPTCQTGGRLLADRSLSRLLRGDWPKTLEELEERKAARRLPKA